MATSTLIHQPLRLTPLTLWHLLSLDAPTVATLWTIFVARALHTPLPPTLPLTMFLAVWLIYATDRLLDTAPHPTRVPQVPAQSHRADPGETHLPTQPLHPRHLFPRTHLLPFAFAILLATSALATLIPTLPHNLLRPYVFLAALFAAWFALVHLTRLTLPKELVPGLFFAAAVFLPVHRAPAAAAIAFAALCTLNCLYIQAWEHPASRVPLGAADRPRPFRSPTGIALPPLTLALALLPLITPTPITIAIAIAIAAISLLLLNHYHHRLPPTTLRAAADLALLTPLLVFPFLH